jgi:HNH endonuclease
MKEVNLTNSSMVAIVDDSDFDEVSRFKWFLNTGGYAARTDYCPIKWALEKNTGGELPMHRHLMGNIKGEIYDHANRDRLDNRRHNLRKATRQTNSRNRVKQKRKILTSLYKGVSRIDPKKCIGPSRRPWVATIKFDGKSHHLGVFMHETEAAIAYNEKAIEVFGEFACLNEVKK